MEKEILEASKKVAAEWDRCGDCFYERRGGHWSCTDFAEAIVEHHERYRWHDLRKNPDDLPDTEKMVDVMVKMLCEWDGVYRVFPMQMSYKAKIMYEKPIGWGIGYPYDFDFETDEVIAWREIEPF